MPLVVGRMGFLLSLIGSVKTVMPLAVGRIQPTRNLGVQLTLSQPGGQIMPTTFLLAHPDLKTQRHLCIIFSVTNKQTIFDTFVFYFMDSLLGAFVPHVIDFQIYANLNNLSTLPIYRKILFVPNEHRHPNYCFGNFPKNDQSQAPT